MPSLWVISPFGEAVSDVLHDGLKIAFRQAALQECAKHDLCHLRIVRVWCKASTITLPPEFIASYAAWRKGAPNIVCTHKLSSVSHGIADGRTQNGARRAFLD
jgi:hypothetical protein